MKIVIATPLYPPEIGKTAAYTKELAKRLSENNEVTIITYGNLPEEIDGVTIIPVNKNLPLLQRLTLFTYQLIKHRKQADIIYAENGSSVELPVGIVTLLTKKSLILHIGDIAAVKHALIRNFVERLSKEVVTDITQEKPEILPFDEVTEEENKKYKESWKNHISILQKLFKKYGK